MYMPMENRVKKSHKSRGIRKRLKDYIGYSVGHLTIIGVERDGRFATAICRCDCGNECRRSLYNLIGKEKNSSCGCNNTAWNRTHGMCRTREYAAWVSMKNRCYNDKYAEFDSYGGRGITVCERWLHSFENFLSDMGMSPGAGYSVDRINNDGDYSPENCRWANRNQQARNKQTTVMVTYRGETRACADWDDIIGCKSGRIWSAQSRGIDMDIYITWLLEMKREYGHCNFVFHRKRTKEKLKKKGLL